MSWLPRQIVVVPIDFSDDSFRALDTARELVDNTLHLHVIYVLPVLEPTEPGVIWHTIDDNSRSEHAEAALKKALAKRGHEQIRLVTRFGDPGHEVADYARQSGADLIVMSSHGRAGLRGLLIGSVAERILRLAHCPVLVLKK